MAAVQLLESLRTLLLHSTNVSIEQKQSALLTLLNELANDNAVSDKQQSQKSQKSQKPQQQHRIVRGYVDGCFDIMHSGHFNALRQAKALCDILVVGVHSDDEIMRHKGPSVMNNEERLAAVKACKWADEVVFDTPYTPTVELLDRLNCDFVVHGDDMAINADGTDAYNEVKKFDRLRIVKRTEGISTTDLVGRMLLMSRAHHQTLDDKLDGQLKCASQVCDVSHNFQQQHYARAVSNFLPTTWRISQFSNHRVPKKDDKIVYIDGSFDLFHLGHIEVLKRAKALGDFLYVGVHDDSVVNQKYGVNHPIMNLHERVLNVLSCRHVDEVIIGAPWRVTKDVVLTLNIHVVAGSDVLNFDTKTVDISNDPYAEPRNLGIFQSIDGSHFLTTSDVVRRVLENRIQYEKRNAGRSKKELDYLQSKTYVQEK